MRELIVKLFALSTAINIFGKIWVTRRAPRVIWPTFILVGTIWTGDPHNWDHYWYHYVAMAILVLVLWIGFNFFGAGYFGLFPYSLAELDDEQEFFYLSGMKRGVLPSTIGTKVYNKLSNQDRIRLKFLHEYMIKKYEKPFSGWKNLLPLCISLIYVVIWYWVIQVLYY